MNNNTLHGAQSRDERIRELSYLVTQMFGKCWHEWGWSGTVWKCSKCGKFTARVKRPDPGISPTNWFTLGKVVSHLRTLPECEEFLHAMRFDTRGVCVEDTHIPFFYFSPVAFIDAFFQWQATGKVVRRLDL